MFKSFTLSILIALIAILFTSQVTAQKELHALLEHDIVTKHNATINGKSIDYTATVGVIAMTSDKDSLEGLVQFTYYKKSGVSDLAKRPLLMSFNGGPGSGAVWMHLAYTGPYVLNIDEEGHPSQPYGYHKNSFSSLDVADILFVNPIATGYSRMVPVAGNEKLKKKFFGINADCKYLAKMLNTFVTKYGRWISPKYLIGESYGGTRVSGLAYELQSNYWMYLNGVVLVSPADYLIYQADKPFQGAMNLPYFTAAAWYHKKLPAALQSKDLLEILPESEKYALDILMPALTRVGTLSKEEKEKIAEKIAYYSGLTKKEILQNNLNVPTYYYWKNLLKDREGKILGRLDSRYKGIEFSNAGSTVKSFPELTAWLHAFAPAVNEYYRKELNFKTKLKYNLLVNVSPWDRTENKTRDQLRDAMLQNPFLNIMYQSGYYDGATNYFHTKYSASQINANGELTDRISHKGYRSGHMMYLRKEDLKTANEDLRAFIIRTSKGGVARYK